MLARFSPPAAGRARLAARLLVCGLLILPALATGTAGYINTILGGGAATTSGSPGTSLALNQPSGIAGDGSGNLFVAEYSSYVVWNWAAATGFATIVLGVRGSSGAGPWSGQAATSTAIKCPVALAYSQVTGVLYVHDTNMVILAVAPNGTVTKFAGVVGYSGSTVGGVPGPARTVSLLTAYAMTFDPSWTILYAGSGNSILQFNLTAAGNNASFLFGNTIASNPSITAYAGDGGPATSATGMVQGVVADTHGNVYLSCSFNTHRVRKIAVGTTTVSTIAGTGTAGSPTSGAAATSTNINYPNSLGIDGGNNVRGRRW